MKKVAMAVVVGLVIGMAGIFWAGGEKYDYIPLYGRTELAAQEVIVTGCGIDTLEWKWSCVVTHRPR